MLLQRCLVLLSIFICHALNSAEAFNCRFGPNINPAQCENIARFNDYTLNMMHRGMSSEKLKLSDAFLQGGLTPDILYQAALLTQNRVHDQKVLETDDVYDDDN